MRYIRTAVATLVMGMLAAACIVPTTDETYSYTVQSDVVYGTGAVNGGASTTDLLLDLYIPDVPTNDRLPLMVMIHGGGFTGGSKTGSNIPNNAREFAERGYLVASINYRLQGSDPEPSARMDPIRNSLGGANAPQIVINVLAAIDDTITALEFLHARNDVFDPWTVLWGKSAGAVTATMTGYILDDYGVERPPVAAVIDLYGGLYGIGVGNPFDDPETDPALFIAHRTGDTVVPYSQTEAIVAQLAQAGGPTSEVYPIVGPGHSINLFTTTTPDGRTLERAIRDFLRNTVFADLPEGSLNSLVDNGPELEDIAEDYFSNL